MEMMDYVQLKTNLKEIVRKIYNTYKSGHGMKGICGFALFSDDDAMSISLAINTDENLQNNIDDDDENKSYYKFSPEEWAEIVENNELDEINARLEAFVYQLKKKQLAGHKKNIYRLCCEVLDESRIEGLFNDMNNDFVLVFSISDSEYLFDDKIMEYNKKYNLRNVAEEYERWIKEEMEYADDDDDDE